MSDVIGIRYPWEDPPAEGEAIEVAQGVLWMRLPLPMALDHVNVYALDDGDSWTIIDFTPQSGDLGKAFGGAARWEARGKGYCHASPSRPCWSGGLVSDRIWRDALDNADCLAVFQNVATG